MARAVWMGLGQSPGLVRWALCSLVLCAGTAQAGLFDDEEARKAILDLRARIAKTDEQSQARTAELNTQMNEQVKALRLSLLDLNAQIQALRGELADMRGTNEELKREISDLQRKQRDIGQAVDDRLRKVEPQKVSHDGREFMAEPDEKRQFDDALAVLRTGDFDKANIAFVNYLRRWPTGGYSDAARFWQANALYGKRDYKEAIGTFRSFLVGAPDSPHAPEAMLAIANSQAEMKDAKAARTTLEDLVKAYPTSEAAVAGKERLASLR
ncbi:MAG: tol-pal system protein YbgF [Rubrivivax sp.]